MILTNLIQTYTAFIETTYPQELTDEQTITNCAISWIGELVEWWETGFLTQCELLEAGDVLYYMVKLLSSLGCDLDLLTAPTHQNSGRDDVDQVALILTNATKKHLYYLPPLYDRGGYAAQVECAAQKTLELLCDGWTLEQIIKGNINKLATRYNVPNPLEVPNESH